MTIREQLEAKYGKPVAPVTPQASGVSVRAQLEAKYKKAPENAPSQGRFFRQGLDNTEKKAKDKLGVAYGLTLPGRAVLRTAAVAGDLLTGSTQKFGDTIGSAIGAKKGAKDLEKQIEESNTIQTALIQRIKEKKARGEDTTALMKVLKETTGQNTQMVSQFYKDNQVLNKTTGQVLGEALGTFGDVAGLGNYSKGITALSKTGKLIRPAKVIPTVAEVTTKVPAIGNVLPSAKEIFKKTVRKIALNTAVGEGYDIAQNLQAGEKGMDILTKGYGKYVGAGISGLGGAYSLTKLGARKVSPSFINSLIGANRDFNKSVKFGNNPGLTATKYGITANNLDEFGQKLGEAKNEVGEIIGNHYNLPENLAKREDYSTIFAPLDDAIAKAKVSPNTNEALIKRLENAKNDLLNGKDFSNANPAEMFQLKQQLKNIMKFTGAPSDDMGVNGALNGVYGRLVSKINKAIPEMAELNKDYGGLLGAELSAGTKAERLKGNALVNFPAKIGTATGVITALATGGAAIPAILAGAGAQLIEKVFSSTAVKTRLAKWLGGATSAEIQSILRNKTIEEQRAVIKAFNDFIEREKLKIPLLEAPKTNVLITPNVGGTPNPLGRAYTPGGESGAIGGLRQKTGNYGVSQPVAAAQKASGIPTNKNTKNAIISPSIPPTSKKSSINMQSGFISTPYKETVNLTTKILKDLEGKTTVSKQYILDATNRGELKQVERDITRQVLDAMPDGQINVKEFADKVKSELLPLKVKNTGTQFGITKYEGIALPKEVRGDIKNYKENIYESPVKTSAGSKHFNDLTDNYFGHTRIEDMADNKTRRVIEVQSDLYQKGNLENKLPKTRVSDELGYQPNKDDVAKLQQYNDRTAHFRMIREEIKKAAQDGKTKLQFPTGETAMKIEGLGENVGNWRLITSEGDRSINSLTPEKLKVGLEVDRDGRWIITDVLGDGKFKAVPKNVDKSINGWSIIEDTTTGGQKIKLAKNEQTGEVLQVRSGDGSPEQFIKKMQDETRQRYAEEFDISGKVDTNNPIYKFYEKDVQKYLNKYGGKRIVDDKGVSWIEVPIKKEYAKQAVEAFGKFKIGALLPIAGVTALGALGAGALKSKKK